METTTSIIRKVIKSVLPDHQGRTLSERGESWISYFKCENDLSPSDPETIVESFKSKYEVWKLVRKFDSSEYVHEDYIVFLTSRKGEYLGSCQFRCKSEGSNLIVNYCHPSMSKDCIHSYNEKMEGKVSYEKVS